VFFPQVRFALTFSTGFCPLAIKCLRQWRSSPWKPRTNRVEACGGIRSRLLSASRKYAKKTTHTNNIGTKKNKIKGDATCCRFTKSSSSYPSPFAFNPSLRCTGSCPGLFSSVVSLLPSSEVVPALSSATKPGFFYPTRSTGSSSAPPRVILRCCSALMSFLTGPSSSFWSLILIRKSN